MPVPGPGYAITARVEVPASASAAGDLTVAIGQVGGVVTALDVVESHTATLVVDISCNALNEDHGREIWEAVKRSAKAGLPVIVMMDSGKLGGRPLAAHWGVVHRIEDSTVYLANTRNVATVSETRFMRTFKCWFMPPRFNHCAVFARPKIGGPSQPSR